MIKIYFLIIMTFLVNCAPPNAQFIIRESGIQATKPDNEKNSCGMPGVAVGSIGDSTPKSSTPKPDKIVPVDKAKFNDILTLKDGSMLMNVKIGVTRKSVIVINHKGEAKVYPKTDLKSAQKNRKYPGLSVVKSVFSEKVKLKNGKVYENAKTAESDGMVGVATIEGSLIVHSKEDIASVQEESSSPEAKKLQEKIKTLDQTIIQFQKQGISTTALKKQKRESEQQLALLSGKQNATSKGNGIWGKFESSWMTWDRANNLCQSQGMRLPTRDELLYAYNSGQSNGCNNGNYWTSSKVTGSPSSSASNRQLAVMQDFERELSMGIIDKSVDMIYNVNMRDGNVHKSPKSKHYYVRCIR